MQVSDMRILFIKEKRSPSGFEGIASYLFNLCQELNKLSIFYLVVYNSEDLFYQKMINNNVNVKLIKFPNSSPKNYAWKRKFLTDTRLEIKGLIDKHHFTHINLHFPSLQSLVLKKWNIPIITHQHGAFEKNTPLPLIEMKKALNLKKTIKTIFRKKVEFNFSKSDKIIVHGKSAYETTVKCFQACPEKIVINSYGSPTPLIEETPCIRSKLGVKPDEKMIISVGRITKAKGIEEFCEVAKKLSTQKKYKFFFCGGYRDEKYYREIKLKYDKYVSFEGMRSDIASYYKSADLNLFLSHREAGGMTLFESLSYSLPSIVFNTAGVREVIENDVNGYKCEFLNINEVIEKTKSILNNESTHQKLKEGSKKSFLTNYRFEDHTKRLLDDFSELTRNCNNERKS